MPYNQHRSHFIFGNLRAAVNSRPDPAEKLDDFLVDVLSITHDLCEVFGGDWAKVVKLAEETPLRAYPRSDETVYTGKVRLFVAKEGKNFGFIDYLLPNKGEVFFHKERGVRLGCDGSDTPVAVGAETCNPKSGDRVLFVEGAGARGPVAVWWAFADGYNQALIDIQNRPTYRFRRRDRDMILWTGKDIASWRMHYPLAWHAADPRWDVALYLIERQDGDAWVEAPDPR